MSFDSIASVYGTLERLCAGRLLHRCRTHHLSSIDPPQNILLLGEGHGRFLGICERHFPAARITVVESSESMIATTRSKQPLTNAHFIHKDVLEWQPDNGSFDLIVTHFVLDCFSGTELSSVIRTLSQAAAQDAQWLIADFEIPNTTIARIRARLIVWLLYRFFRTLTRINASQLISPDLGLTDAGFALRQRATFDWGLLKSELWHRH